MSDKQADGMAAMILRMRKMLEKEQGQTASRLFRRKPKPRPAFTAEKRYATGRGDFVVAGLGIGLGLLCALFPWYIFFNQEQFGIRAIKFEGGGQADGPVELAIQPERVGAPSESAEIPPSGLDLLATGTLPKEPDEAGVPPPGLREQPFPAAGEEFKLVFAANGRAMIEDDSGLFVVQPGSRLPDNSRVAAIEQREGRWVLVTTADQVIELDR
ncbi:hypothetical protein SAMN04488498_11852 [Mesorhizobium albiziae]|uniref:Uncharacterized protein n=1 Tax=Neomesorhizobium albiziae TaxID=335020 RepID=A0A1I4DMJ7_9HYPH|nr:hypothetical protein [Mesorhizobium albiziae]GLS31305.1 hypothetical protein GCM10007937_30150 [Mesorhizobium albiziae]SFK93970.1 hypothetical protein SAMN04488498_11852 [Mesorhizobium albiziae]